MKYITVEHIDDGSIVRISLNRPKQRNAQHRGLLVELDQAFADAEADDTVRVIILAGNGPSFSAGHDLGSAEAHAQRDPGPDQHPSFQEFGGTRKGAERRTLQESQFYFRNTLRWRNVQKITIAQVHGKVLSAGLMLMWACDLITAGEDTEFADVVATRMGMCGVEYFAHPWEFGPRRAKEMLLTGDSMNAEEAYQIGMVSKVFDRDTLADQTIEFARRIAALPTAASVLVKESVNQAVDNMGFYSSLQAGFSLHQLNHAHWAEIHDDGYHGAHVEDGIEDWRNPSPIQVRNPNKASG